MIPRALTDAAAELLAKPRPVLFFDTCDVVNLIQVITTVELAELRAVVRLLNALNRNPNRCQPVGTFVTAVEFIQKMDPADPVYQKDNRGKPMPPAEVAKRLKEIDAGIEKLHAIRQILRQPLPPPAIVYSNLNLLADLRALADRLLGISWELQRDPVCVNAAVDRVFSRTRPSQTREVKDSIHLEHCLELARRLRQGGFTEAIVFTSANKNDYGPADGTQPHFELRGDFAAANVLYFDTLGRGIGHLGI